MSSKLDPESWRESAKISMRSWLCAFCGKKTWSDRGYFYGRLVPPKKGATISCIAICSECGFPTFFAGDGKAHPDAPPGEPVDGVPDDLSRVYEEARRTLGVGAYTGSFMLCRAILVSIARQEGAPDGQSFGKYVRHLERAGLVPRKARAWADRLSSHDASELSGQLPVVSRAAASELLTFVEYLLRFTYEFPHRVPDTEPGRQSAELAAARYDQEFPSPQTPTGSGGRRPTSRSRK